MSGIHSPISRDFFTLNGAVRTSGGSKNLAKGEFAVVNKNKPTADGAAVIGSFAGLPKSTVYELRLGKSPVAEVRSGDTSNPYASHTFTIEDVKDIRVSAPKVKNQKFDSYIIGYDGINADSAIVVNEGASTVIDLVLYGDAIRWINPADKYGEYKVKLHFNKEVGQTDQEVVRAAVKRLQAERFPTQVPLTDFVDIKLVDSSHTADSGTLYNFSTLTLTDAGDSNSLALVQAQYPAYKVQRTDRVGLVSTYSILAPASVSLSAYSVSIPSYIKDCENCLAGYSALTGGVVYSVSIEDDGVDLTTTVDDLPGFVTGSAVKIGQDVNNNGRGLYSLVLDNTLTDAEITTFLTATAVKGTATIKFVGTVEAVCSNATTTTTAWITDNTCYASIEQYKIQLKDTDCDGSQLTKLQAAYPQLTIEEGAPNGTATQTVTLSGVSGNASVIINGVTYTTAFNTDLTTTAADFVTAHAAAILADTGIVVTSALAVITLTGDVVGFPSVVAVAGGLTEAVSALDLVTDASTGGCQRVYSTSVVTNVMCADCDPIFTSLWTATAPADYDFIPWTKVVPASDATAKMGILITGKPFILDPAEALRDQMPFMETSVRFKIAGGYIEEPNWSNEPVYDNGLFKVKQLSRAEDRDHLGGHLRYREDMSMVYFNGIPRHRNNLVAKAVLGEESVLDARKQYVDYTIVIKDNKYSQGVGKSSDMGIAYIVHAEVGKHTVLEAMINKIAAKAGLDAVQAFANV